MTPAPATTSVLGVEIHALRMQDVVAACDCAIERRERLLIGVVNAAKLVNMRRDNNLRDAVLAADLILADGMSVVWASRLKPRRLPERVAGIDLMTALLARAAERGYRIYCLGADRQTLAAAVERMRSDHAGVQIVGSRDGYFSDADEPAVVEDIRAAAPDILFAAMSSPKKEMFLARWAGTLGAPVCHGVGGAFDVVAGKVRRAPALWQRLGLEWLYRVMQEPGRLWKRYFVTNTLFTGLVLRESLFPRRAPGA
jgi:N-acetylglucosaminyldiphosphoundecaprenol N-acetyl-beta-D-mannosaminyltransferase